MQPTVKQIKVSTTGKGEYHWEDYLLQKQKTRLNKLMHYLSINPWKQRAILKAFKQKVTRENIVALSQHDIRIFLLALIRNELKDLQNTTSGIK